MIRLFLIEDHPVTVAGLKNMFRSLRDGISITVTAATVEEALQQTTDDFFDIILLDPWLGRGDAEVNTRRLVRRYPQKSVILFMPQERFHLKHPLLGAGALGFIDKSCKKAEIIASLKRFYTVDAMLPLPHAVSESSGRETPFPFLD